jgi:E3 SUMO-protein ligase PIAS1
MICLLGRNTLKDKNLAIPSSYAYFAGYGSFRDATKTEYDLAKMREALLREAQEATAKKLAANSNNSASNKPSSSDDIELGDTIISFKCPLTLCRMQMPVKGEFCRHAQTFDAFSYLTFTAEKSLWKCIVCKAEIRPRNLKVDFEVLRLLEKYPDAEKCVLKADGTDESYDAQKHEVGLSGGGGHGGGGGLSGGGGAMASNTRPGTPHSAGDTGIVIDLDDDTLGGNRGNGVTLDGAISSKKHPTKRVVETIILLDDDDDDDDDVPLAKTPSKISGSVKNSPVNSNKKSKVDSSSTSSPAGEKVPPSSSASSTSVSFMMEDDVIVLD